MIIIGTDEAGYGPNLGPLVIAATAWQVPAVSADCDLYETLSDAVCHHAGDEQCRIAIADSKLLYRPGGSLAALETSVHVGLSLLQRSPKCWRTTFEMLSIAGTQCLPAVPWHGSYYEPLPMAVDALTVQHCANRLGDACETNGIKLLDLRATVIFPHQFNARVRQLGSKGSLLTEQTLKLINDLLSRCHCDNAQIYCDKHGGRNHYAAALQHCWPDSWVNVLNEGRASSEYAIGFRDHDVRFRFAVGGESQLASALASMVAKYLRELAMRAFNAFWQSHVAGLRATAGYPIDAHRFKRDIETAQRRLNIEDDTLWRCR